MSLFHPQLSHVGGPRSAFRQRERATLGRVDEWLQRGFGVRFDWGPTGAGRLAPGSALAVVVDVLSFTTSVSVLVEAGTRVYPYPWQDGLGFARHHGAALAVGRRAVTAETPWSLSPAALRRAPATPRLVLPSPNGSAIAAAIQDHCGLVAGSLRNAGAVGRWLASCGVGTVDRPLTVVAAGERWPDGSLRPALEDLLGAGAVIAALGACLAAGAGSRRPQPPPGLHLAPTGSPAPTGGSTPSPEEARAGASLSPEAAAALAAFRACADIPAAVATSASGRELAATGFAQDVAVAVEVDASTAVPLMVNGAFSAAGPGSDVG